MTKRHDAIALDTLRGLACLLLVAYHVVGSDPSSGLRIQDGPLRLLNDGLAYLRMPLFTFLSGVVYGLRPFAGDSRAFLGGKLRRLLVPMLFIGTLFALAQSFIPGTNFQASSSSRVWWLMHAEPVAHFWFVEALFWVFLLVWALERARWLATARQFATVWMLAVAVTMTVRAPHWFALDGAFYLLPYFLGGLAITRFALLPRLATPAMRVLLVVTAIVAIAQLGVPTPNPDRFTPWVLLAGVALCALLLGLGWRSTWLARIGTSSYAIYLLHVFFTSAARLGLNTAELPPLLPMLPLQIAGGVLFGVGGPMLVEHWARRHDTTRLLLLGKAPRRAPAPPRTTPACGAAD